MLRGGVYQADWPYPVPAYGATRDLFTGIRGAISCSRGGWYLPILRAFRTRPRRLVAGRDLRRLGTLQDWFGRSGVPVLAVLPKLSAANTGNP
jgi:hypothetical protein